VLNRLLSFIVRATNITPAYAPEHCLVVTKAVGGCTVCEETCPHRAITIGRAVEIDEIDCTGCGLCVQACPSQALSSSVSYSRGAPLKCSQVQGDAQSVQCLTRLQPSDLLALAGSKDRVTLVRGACEGCKIGSPEVPARLAQLLEDAVALAAVRGRTLHTEVLVRERYDTTDNPETLSRRELLRGGLRSSQRFSADLLAPLEALGETQAGEKGVPLELEKRFLLLRAAQPDADARVPWRLPRVHDGCIMCPVCTNVCPTGAFKRELNPIQVGGGGVLKLEPERCNGCNACVTSCPVRVITLDDKVTWGELSGGTQEVYRKAGGASTGSIARR
jgi:ferredoxin